MSECILISWLVLYDLSVLFYLSCRIIEELSKKLWEMYYGYFYVIFSKGFFHTFEASMDKFFRVFFMCTVRNSDDCQIQMSLR